MLVACFGSAQYKCTDNRLSKPFNPILGETFELVGPEYTYFAEQVLHHPPVSACIGESKHYTYHMDTNTKMSISIRGRLDAIPIGYQHIRLKTTGEHYIIGRPNTCVGNLLFGTMYLEHVGTMFVKNCTTGHVCSLEFKSAGWTGTDKHVVQGAVYASEQESKNRG